MAIRYLFAVAMCIIVSLVPGRCDSRQIDRERIFSALKSSFVGTPLEAVPFSVDKVKLPTRIFLRYDAEIQLNRFSLDRHAHAIDVSLKCNKSACMPFYVTLVDVDAPAGLEDKRTFGNGRRPETGGTVSNGKRSEPVVRRGEMASLSIQRDGVHISAPAVCLEQGFLGRLIRARIVGTNRVTVAKVVGPRRVSAEEPR